MSITLWGLHFEMNEYVLAFLGLLVALIMLYWLFTKWDKYIMTTPISDIMPDINKNPSFLLERDRITATIKAISDLGTRVNKLDMEMMNNHDNLSNEVANLAVSVHELKNKPIDTVLDRFKAVQNDMDRVNTSLLAQSVSIDRLQSDVKAIASILCDVLTEERIDGDVDVLQKIRDR